MNKLQYIFFLFCLALPVCPSFASNNEEEDTLTVIGKTKDEKDITQGNLDELIQNNQLAGATFKEPLNLTTFDGANLKNKNLKNKNLTKTNVSDVKFDGSTLDKAQFDGAECRGTSFRVTSLIGTSFGPHKELVDNQVVITKTILDYAKLIGATAHGAKFNEASCRETKFGASQLEGADFTDADLENASLVETNLSDATLIKTKLNKADLTWANCTNADFTEATLFWVDLKDTNIDRAKFNNADLDQVRNLDQAKNLHSADFSGASLQGVDLRSFDLDTYTNLLKANLNGVIMTQEQVNQHNLQNLGITIEDLPSSNDLEWILPATFFLIGLGFFAWLTSRSAKDNQEDTTSLSTLEKI